MKTVSPLLSAVVALAVSPLLHADHHKHPADLSGVWKVNASTDNGSRKLTWTFTEKDGKLGGSSLGHEEGNERDFDRIVVKEKKVTIETDIEGDGRKGVIRVEAEEKSPGMLAGKWSIVGDDDTEYASGEFTAKKEVRLAGEWVASAELPDGATNESTLTLAGKNSGLKGELDGELGKVELDKVTLSDEELRLEFEFEVDGTPLEVTIKVKPEGNDKLVGKWMAVGDDGSVAAEGKWTAKRKATLAGKWSVVASVPDNADYHGTLTLAAKNGKYTGTSQADNGESKALTAVKVNGKSVEFTVPFEYQGNTGTITVEAKLQKDGSLKGEWVLTGGDDDTEYVRESWKATKK